MNCAGLSVADDDCSAVKSIVVCSKKYYVYIFITLFNISRLELE